jgi:hypothetical protein
MSGRIGVLFGSAPATVLAVAFVQWLAVLNALGFDRRDCCSHDLHLFKGEVGVFGLIALPAAGDDIALNVPLERVNSVEADAGLPKFEPAVGAGVGDKGQVFVTRQGPRQTAFFGEGLADGKTPLWVTNGCACSFGVAFFAPMLTGAPSGVNGLKNSPAGGAFVEAFGNRSATWLTEETSLGPVGSFDGAACRRPAAPNATILRLSHDMPPEFLCST